MQTRFEQFAVTSMLGSDDSPPRQNGKLCFSQPWERQAFGVALALSKKRAFRLGGFQAEADFSDRRMGKHRTRLRTRRGATTSAG